MAQDLLNRIKKRMNHLHRWAKTENTTAFRIYDRDIPNYPYSVDWYDGSVILYHYTKQRLNQVTKDSVKASIDPEPGVDLIQGIATTLGIAETEIYLKTRARRSEHEQYQKIQSQALTKIIREHDLQFLVNLSDFIDTGIFLDARPLRKLVRRSSESRRVLNLFCYTGTASVHALAGNATRCVSVDLSNRALAWTRENLKLNGLLSTERDVIRGDCLAVLRDLRAGGEQFDLIYADPPSFSNSKAMQGTFDVQRDHVALLRLCKDVLSPRGVIIFCNNLRGFKMEAEAIPGWSVENISQRTIPEDFRNSKIHNAWWITPDPDPSWRERLS